MKIRTDFVTNSSSSSYCVWVGVTLKDGENIGYSASIDDSRDSGYLEQADIEKCKNAKNLDSLICILKDAVKYYPDMDDYCPSPFGDDDEDFDYYDSEKLDKAFQKELETFERDLRKSANSLDDILKVTIKGTELTSGGQANTDVVSTVFDCIDEVAREYPSLSKENYKSFPNLLDDVKKILIRNDFMRDNDPEEFVLDYMEAIHDSAVYNADYHTNRIHPIKEVNY